MNEAKGVLIYNTKRSPLTCPQNLGEMAHKRGLRRASRTKRWGEELIFVNLLECRPLSIYDTILEMVFL